MDTVTPPTPPTTSGSPTSDHDRGIGLATAGLLLVVLAVSVFLVGTVVDGGTDDTLGLFVVALVVPLAAAGLAATGRRGATVAALVLTVVIIVGLYWVALGVRFLTSPIEFTAAVSFTLGVALALWGEAASLRRGRVVRRTRPVVVAIAIVALAAIASAAMVATSGETVTDELASGADLVVTMAGFRFVEEAYVVDADEPVTVLLRNDDRFVHDLTVPELGVATTVAPGDEVLVELTAPAGEYTIYCSLHSDMGVEDPTAAGMAALLDAG